MDAGGDVGNEIPLSASFPLPYRVLFLAGVGILGWATNLHGLELLGIDVVAALDLRVHDGTPYLPVTPRPFKHKSSAAPIYTAVYRLCFAYSAVWITSWALFRFCSFSNPSTIDEFAFVPTLTGVSILAFLICPFNVFEKFERDKFLSAVKRCVSSPRDSPIYFSDVVFADIFTSFAKVLGDVWLSAHMLLPGNTLLFPPIHDGWLRWIQPTIMSLPYAVRFRQCVIEYALPSNDSRRPLYNAIKYATAFPVIYLSAAQRLVVIDVLAAQDDQAARQPWHGEHVIFRTWLLAAAVNSFYSFWWDVSNDWGLDLLKRREADEVSDKPSPPKRLILPSLGSSTPLITRASLSSTSLNEMVMSAGPTSAKFEVRKHQNYPYGLRPTLLYPLPVYPLLIFLNLILRLTWSIKLSSHLHSQTDGSMAIFWLEMAEILRRWMWVFIRVEWEVIKKRRSVDSRRSGEVGEGTDYDYELVTTPAAERDELL